MNAQYVSPEGLEKIKQELEQRTTVLRQEIATRIREAKEHGDLAENAEYTEAKEAQSLNEGRIEELKMIIENAVLISEKHARGVVSIGSSVTVESQGAQRTFIIVGNAESNPGEGFISNESPLGDAFLGRKKGDMVEVQTPKGPTEYSILDVK